MYIDNKNDKNNYDVDNYDVDNNVMDDGINLNIIIKVIETYIVQVNSFLIK